MKLSYISWPRLVDVRLQRITKKSRKLNFINAALNDVSLIWDMKPTGFSQMHSTKAPLVCFIWMNSCRTSTLVQLYYHFLTCQIQWCSSCVDDLLLMCRDCMGLILRWCLQKIRLYWIIVLSTCTTFFPNPKFENSLFQYYII